MSACRSLSEPGLWDYVITNETMEGTGKQLADIAGRALAGQIGNGIAELQDPDVSQALTKQTVRLSTDHLLSDPAVTLRLSKPQAIAANASIPCQHTGFCAVCCQAVHQAYTKHLVLI